MTRFAVKSNAKRWALGKLDLRHALLTFATLGLMFNTFGCSGTVPQNKNLLLIQAAEKGQTVEMVSLIRDGADINAIDEEGWTPYLAASTNGQLNAMKLLRAFGARTDAPEKETVARFNMVR